MEPMQFLPGLRCAIFCHVFRASSLPISFLPEVDYPENGDYSSQPLFGTSLRKFVINKIIFAFCIHILGA